MQQGLPLCPPSHCLGWARAECGFAKGTPASFPPPMQQRSGLPALSHLSFPTEQHCQEAIPLTCAYQTRSR